MESRQPLEAEKDKETNSSLNHTEGMQSWQYLDFRILFSRTVKE